MFDNLKFKYYKKNMKEITVTIKGSESSYKQNFLVYEEISWDENDPQIKKCVEEALSNAKIEPECIKVRGLLQLV